MPLAPGTQLSVYHIVSRIGAGGMGEVYRARDTKLDRDVAIKVLPDEFAADEARLARFEREAKLLASLNHPNIASIHGYEEGDGVKALVLELVEGPTLAERIQNGPIPLEDAVPIARQIAEALEAGHEAGVIHRDLKPANVKLKEDGTVKVLDYGLAKALDIEDTGESKLSQSPTLSRQATQAGVILGTAAYMSPEQAKGKRIDRRTDIWAFGVVVFEMLAGKSLFTGETITDVLAAVVREDIDWRGLPPKTPRTVKRLLDRCLDRDPKRRLRDIGEARIALEDALTGGEPRDDVTLEERRPARAVALAGAGIVIGALSAALLGSFRSPDAPVRALHVDSGELVKMPQVSPDGRTVAYVRNDRLVVRELDSFETRELEGTDDASNPFWTEDGASIGYFGSSELRRIPARGGASQMLAPMAFPPYGGASCQAGFIFTTWGTGFRRIENDGRENPWVVVDPSQNETNLAFPHCLPDGRVLGVIRREVDNAIVVFDAEERTTLLELPGEGAAWPVFVTSGHVLFERRGANPGIWAVPVNDDLSSTTGPPVLILPEARQPSVSRDGVLVAESGTKQVDRRLVWVDREGRQLSEFGRPAPEFLRPDLSPDGARVVVALRTPGPAGTFETWAHHEATSQRLTWIPSIRFNALHALTPTGERLAFQGSDGIYIAPSERAGDATLVVETTGGDLDWSVDGQSLLYTVVSDSDGDSRDVWIVTLNDGAEPRLLLEDAETPALSPDGRLLAFVSMSTGRREIYVTTFPQPGRIWPVSEEGGRYPRWSPRGGELFFAAGPVVEDDPNSHRDLYVAAIETGTEVVVSRPEKLFDAESLGLRLSIWASRGYDVSPDGQRILLQTSGIEGVPTIAIIDDVTAWIRSRS